MSSQGFVVGALFSSYLPNPDTLGAGQYVVAEALRSFPQAVSITIAGRSASKLEALVQMLQATDRLKVLGGVDVADAASVETMAKSARCVCMSQQRVVDTLQL